MNTEKNMHIWFWQRILTPHMVELASEIARLGCEVTYVAEEEMSKDRSDQGWVAPKLPGVRVEFARATDNISMLVASAPKDSIHICQGIRANGFVGLAQRAIKKRRLRQWIVMETVDEARLRGLIKRFEYWRLFSLWRKQLRGILAIGQSTPQWVADRGIPKSRIFPFAYFLKDLDFKEFLQQDTHRRFRFVFVGQFIDRKKIDFLLNALHRVNNQDFELTVVGSGPMELKLRTSAEKLFPGRLIWAGCLPLDLTMEKIANADCLVLPSRHDGWGAVVSEAMMVGTPVICSNTCGSAIVVRASGKGGIFKNGDLENLIDNLQCVLSAGMVSEAKRIALANWASCLGAKAGASYLLNILKYDESINERPFPPWVVDF